MSYGPILYFYLKELEVKRGRGAKIKVPAL